MPFTSEWKKAAAAIGTPLPLIALAMTLSLNVAAYRTPAGGWQALFLVFAGLAASAFGGIVITKYIAAPSPLALKAESAEAMIGIARKSIDKRHSDMPVIDDVLALAQTELRRNNETYDPE